MLKAGKIALIVVGTPAVLAIGGGAFTHQQLSEHIP